MSFIHKNIFPLIFQHEIMFLKQFSTFFPHLIFSVLKGIYALFNRCGFLNFINFCEKLFYPQFVWKNDFFRVFSTFFACE